jgi:ATP-dependent RNA helicase HelY
VRQQEESLAGYEKAMRDDTGSSGDFTEYASIRREISDLERRNAQNRERGRGERDKDQRALATLRQRLRSHPAHSSPRREELSRWGERWWRLKRQTDDLRRQIESRTGAVAKVFDRVTEVLLSEGYLKQGPDGVQLTGNGVMLKRIYGERDLLVAETLRRSVWTELDPAGFAALATTLVFEPRREEAIAERYLPRGAFRPALERVQEIWSRLDDVEREHRLAGSNPPSTGLATAMHRWARGGALDQVLRDADLAAGDFVRWSKQTIDLLDQISIVADGRQSRTARQAIDAVRRGIVAYSSVG